MVSHGPLGQADVESLAEVVLEEKNWHGPEIPSALVNLNGPSFNRQGEIDRVLQVVNLTDVSWEVI